MDMPNRENDIKTEARRGEDDIANRYTTYALAYLGDAVIELLVREKLTRAGLPTSQQLNAAALRFVRAKEQAAAVHRILPILSEEEAAVFKRGRNIGHTNVPKNASTADYRAATGMEALFGYLHLLGRWDRMRELFEAAYAEEETVQE